MERARVQKNPEEQPREFIGEKMDAKKHKIVKLYRSGKDVLLRLPKELVQELELQPGTEIVLTWDRETKTVVMRKVEV